MLVVFVLTDSGACDTEYAHNTALKIGTALVNYYVPLAVMAVLYSRIFVAIRRRSKLEIWQNAVIVAGGSRTFTSSSDSSNIATSRKLLDSKHDEDQDEGSDEETASCRRRSRDDDQRVIRQLFGHEAAPSHQSTVVVDQVRSDRDELDARSTVLHADELENLPVSTLNEQSQPAVDERHKPAVDGRRKCVRFLLVRQHESDSNDVDDLDQIEMWSDKPNDYDTSSDQRPGGSGLPARLLRSLRHRIPKGRRHDNRQKQSSLSSDVKAAKQLGVIMGAFCVCFLPYFVCFVVVALCRQCVDDQLMTTVTWIGYVNSTLNPFLYPLCNQQFRVSFRRMFATVLNLGSTSRGTGALSVTG